MEADKNPLEALRTMMIDTIRVLTVLCALLLAYPALAQTTDQNAPPAPKAAPAPAAPEATASPPSAPAADVLKPAELDGLVAPIALYPDTLLANVLMAATYPLEVVRAERWIEANSKLKGDALKAAAEVLADSKKEKLRTRNALSGLKSPT